MYMCVGVGSLQTECVTGMWLGIETFAKGNSFSFYKGVYAHVHIHTHCDNVSVYLRVINI